MNNCCHQTPYPFHHVPAVFLVRKPISRQVIGKCSQPPFTIWGRSGTSFTIAAKRLGHLVLITEEPVKRLVLMKIVPNPLALPSDFCDVLIDVCRSCQQKTTLARIRWIHKDDNMAVPAYKDILDLLKAGATIEAQEKIMELRQEALAIQEDNIQLRNRVLELEARIRELETLEGEACPRCRKRTWVVISSRPDPTFADLGGVRRTYKCTECGLTEDAIVTPEIDPTSGDTERRYRAVGAPQRSPRKQKW